MSDHRRRNDSLFDSWSVVHVFSGVLFGWIMDPFVALVILTLWEPLEILVISPILAKYGIVFGHEALRNSLSDIVFNIIGLLIGIYLLREFAPPPFYLFG